MKIILTRTDLKIKCISGPLQLSLDTFKKPAELYSMLSCRSVKVTDEMRKAIEAKEPFEFSHNETLLYGFDARVVNVQYKIDFIK